MRMALLFLFLAVPMGWGQEHTAKIMPTKTYHFHVVYEGAVTFERGFTAQNDEGGISIPANALTITVVTNVLTNSILDILDLPWGDRRLEWEQRGCDGGCAIGCCLAHYGYRVQAGCRYVTTIVTEIHTLRILYRGQPLRLRLLEKQVSKDTVLWFKREAWEREK